MEKKWYKTKWGVVAIVLLFPLFLMGYLSKLIWQQKWRKQTRILLIALLWGSVLISGFVLDWQEENTIINCTAPDGKILRITKKACDEVKIAWPKQKKSTTPLVSSTPIPTNTSVKKHDYEILEKKDGGSVENYKVLINAGDDGKAIAMEIKETCNKPCNIDIYDDKRALELQKQYDAMMGTLDTQPEDLQAWKKNNYVFVADHLLGYLTFDTGEYMEYPYRDWYYKELKGN